MSFFDNICTMQVQYKATGIEMTEAIAQHLEKRCAFVEKFTHGEGRVFAEVSRTTNHHKSGDVYRCELQCEAPGMVVRAEAETTDLYKAIDLAKDDLERQIVKFKEKQRG